MSIMCVCSCDMADVPVAACSIWTYDSNRVTIRNCSSYDNLSSLHDGSGFDLDLGVNNSVIEYCNSYNNYGSGFQACTGGSYPPNVNNTSRHCTSYGDGYGIGYASFSVWVEVGTSYIKDLTLYNNSVTVIDTAPCKYYGWGGAAHYGFCECTAWR